MSFHTRAKRYLTAFRPRVQRDAVFWAALILAFGVPILGKIIHGCPIQPAISTYYHTGAHDLYVGLLCALGLFLLSYRGAKFDTTASVATCVAALATALFPPSPEYVDPKYICFVDITPLFFDPRVSIFDFHVHVVHAVSMFALFILMLLLVYRFHREEGSKGMGCDRLLCYYRICLVVMALGGLIFVGAFLWRGITDNSVGPMIWVGETLAILAFAVAWRVKAGT